MLIHSLYVKSILRQLDYHMQKKKKRIYTLTSHQLQNSSKWIKYLILRDKTIHVLEENIGINLGNLEFDNSF